MFGVSYIYQTIITTLAITIYETFMDTLPSITACKVKRLQSGAISVYTLPSRSNTPNTGCFNVPRPRLSLP